MQVIKLKVVDIEIPSDRQRKDAGNIEELMKSIQANGLINPITVSMIDGKPVLVAGFRRLTAHKIGGLKTIHAQILETATPAEREIIELDENVKRKQLTWMEEVSATARIHTLLSSIHSDWNVQASADYIGMGRSWLWKLIEIDKCIASGDEQIIASSGISGAMNILSRRRSRELESEITFLDETLELDQPPEHLPAQASTEGEVPPSASPSVRPADKDILFHDFLEFSKSYSGPPFNFIHCDFPYGIGHDKSAQGGAAVHGAYDDSEEIYWELLHALCSSRDKILAPSAHIMFWFSMGYYSETIDFLERNASDLRCDPFPLIWHKSDNRGILPDPDRGPRRVYETALLLTRGDRRVVAPIANGYSGPTAKVEGGHISTKPVPMLKHFFRMLVDEHSAVLDPTCGSGSAIIAAEERGAKRVLGLDKEKEYVETARANLRRARQLRFANEALNDNGHA